MRKILAIAIIVMGAAMLTGCLNMPTPPTQITGAYVSDLKYEEYDCKRLIIEYDHLVQREAQLVAAQNQRIKSSETQAFWWGYGQGDGMEASELSIVRGQISAVKKAMDIKGCGETTSMRIITVAPESK